MLPFMEILPLSGGKRMSQVMALEGDEGEGGGGGGEGRMEMAKEVG